MARRLTDGKVQRILDFAADEREEDDETVALRETLTLPLASLVEGRFEIQSVIGQGGMAVVHRAVDRHTGTVVALKTCRMSMAPDLARLWREIAIIQRLEHPTIPRYVAHGRLDASTAFLAMELLTGVTLQARLAGGPLHPSAVAALGRRLASALAAAHRAGVVHRDVKPSNVFLVDGDPEKAVLLDFGLARRTAMAGDLTATGAFIGTPGYAAPEQVRDAASVGAAADVFGLGVVLYEALAGAAPFAAASRTERVARLLAEEPSPLAELCPAAPRDLCALVHRALAKAPIDRPADGAAMLAELGGAVAVSLLDLTLGRTLGCDEIAVDLEATWRTALVTVRRYRRSVVARPEAAQRIARAARSASRLVHDLAAPPIEVISTVEELLVLSRPSPGPRLDELLSLARSRRARPSLAVCRSVVLDVLDVLAAAHAIAGQPVVHGDVQGMHVSIAPGGEAILGGLCSSAESVARSMPGEGRWKAPEVSGPGAALVGPSSDVFGAAALLVRVATAASTGGGRASELRALLGVPLAVAIERALRHDQRSRGSLGDLRHALEDGAERQALRADVRAWARALGALR